MTIIIGISGITGAGKSTLGIALARELKATSIGWDDFDEISTGPEDYVDWYKRGQDYNEWNYSELANTLQTLKSKQSIVHPVNQQLSEATEFVVFDAPLGRLHRQTGQYIDICVHIEVPLDVSLCRRLLRDFKEQQTKESLLEELDFYLNEARPLFFDDALKNNANLIIDGMLSTELQVYAIRQFLQDKTKG